MPLQSDPEVARLIQAAAESAGEHVDIPGAISLLVKQGIVTQIEPYVLAGVLVESLAAVMARTPVEQQQEVTLAVFHMLRDRLVAIGIDLG